VIREPANARSRRTRVALLDAALSLLADGGFQALTMTAVAQRASVTRRTVYLHFGTRTELVAALFDHVAEREGLSASLEHVWRSPDAATALDRWAHHLAHYHRAVLPIDRAVQAGRAVDADAEAHARHVARMKMTGCRRLAGMLAGSGRLRDGWGEPDAADVLYAISTSDVVEGLIVDRRWSAARCERQVGRLLRGALLAGE
jgi:AcrR family transcriptional regulator